MKKPLFSPGIILLIVGLVVVGSLVLLLRSQNQALRQQTGQQLGPNDLPEQEQTIIPEAVSPLTDEDYTKGSLNEAQIAFVVYADLNCSFCKQFHEVINEVLEEYGANVAFAYRHFPIVGSNLQAEAAECVGKQGGNSAFMEFIDRYYDEISSSAAAANITASIELASDLGFDIQSCLDNGETSALVAADEANAMAIGIVGTPSMVLIDYTDETETKYQLLQGAYTKEDLDIELQRRGLTPQ